MGAVCCCCRDEPRPQPGNRPQGGAWQPINTAPTPTPRRDRCDICSRTIDPCLLDGHRESCRAQHRRRMHEQQAHKPSPSIKPHPPPSLVDALEELPPELLCIVCMEKRKEYAFVPCGHIIGCSDCARSIDMCPVCRTQRVGLLRLNPQDNVCLCKHCGHVITPAFFDGHREVCSLRMRQLREQAETTEAPDRTAGPPDHTAHANGQSSTGPVTPSTADEVRMCVDCKHAERNTALLPCAHRVLCRSCATAATLCPVCLTAVTSVVTTYET